METSFGDTEGNLLFDYKDKERHYADLLKQLKEAEGNKKGKMDQRYDPFARQRSLHKIHITLAYLHDCGFQALIHPSFSPDLTPFDFHLFPN